MQDYTQYAVTLLPLFGAAFQWLRQHNSFKEESVAGLVGVLAIITYVISHKFGHDWRAESYSCILGVLSYSTQIAGGTAFADFLANKGIAFVPKANSK